MTNLCGSYLGREADGGAAWGWVGKPRYGYEPARSSISKSKIKASDVVASTSEFDPEHPLYDKVLVFTGTLESLTRKEAMQKVVNAGGKCMDSVNKRADYLVVGEKDFNKLRGGNKSSKMLKFEKLISEGFGIEIIKEDDFLKMLIEWNKFGNKFCT